MKATRFVICILMAILTSVSMALALSAPELSVVWTEAYNVGDTFSDGVSRLFESTYLPGGALTGEYGYVNVEGELIRPVAYQEAYPFSDGLGLILEGRHYRFIDGTGQVVLSPDGKFVRSFSEGLAAVQKREGDGYGYIDKTGALVIPAQYTDAGLFSEGLASVNLRGQWGYIDTTGAVVIPHQFRMAQPFSEGLAAVQSWDGKWGYIDKTGELVLTYQYDEAGPFQGGIAMVQYRDSYWNWRTSMARYETLTNYINRDGASWSDFAKVWDYSQGPCLKQYFDHAKGRELLGYHDKDGNLVAKCGERPPSFREDGASSHNVMLGAGSRFQNGYALYVRDGRAALVDDQFHEVAHLPGVRSVSDFSDGTAWVSGADETGKIRYGIVRFPESLMPRDDVSAWAQKDVSCADLYGLLTERTRTGYSDSITRLQFAELVVNLVEQTAGEAISPAAPDQFSDTQDEAARKAFAAGIVAGVGDGTKFAPDDAISREQIAVMLDRAAERLETQSGLCLPPPAKTKTVYDDQAQVSAWATEAVGRMVTCGIINGTSERTLSPQGATTVEQAIALILRVYQAIER